MSRFQKEKGTETIQVKTLDSYNFKNVDIIKMDVEGYELFALEGARETIERCLPVVQLEILENNLKSFNVKPEQLFDFFKDIENGLSVLPHPHPESIVAQEMAS